MGKDFEIEYGNDMPGSAFEGTGGGGGDAITVDETAWNMRRISRAKGSLLKCMREEVPGVTSPMVYIGMMFSWFAWHVEDHDLHSLNYMHMGAGKTWYGVPRDAARAFEDVIRVHGYGGEINLVETFANLAQKTTVMSPEILVKLGIPCCRLVQNAGEFVVTFPRAYHSGFSHGFNLGEASNFATHEWLKVAREAAIRRTSIISPPMVAHTQLLYDLAVSMSSRAQNTRPEPRSSRLKDRLKVEGEFVVKRLFLEDMIENCQLLHVLAKGSTVVLLSEDSLDGLVSSYSCFAPSVPRTQSFISKDVDTGSSREKHFDKENAIIPDPSLISCVSCGVCCYPCFAIVQPTEVVARCLMSVNCRDINDLVATVDFLASNEDDSAIDPNSFSNGKMPKRAPNGPSDIPIKRVVQMRVVDNIVSCFKLTNIPGTTSVTGSREVNSSLALLALAYGDSLDSDDDFERLVHDSCYASLPVGNSDSGYKKLVMEPNCSGSRFESQIEVNNPTNDSRKHIFCLHHAMEVEHRLRQFGGAHILLICHQDFSKFDAMARLVAQELGADDTFAHIEFRDFSNQDNMKIQSAINIDEGTHGYQDWTVKLGLNILHSARLSRLPVYGKQIPYNLVIYQAFGENSPSFYPVKPKSLRQQKKIVVIGKWCGKVWMSNHVHPLLRGIEEQEHETQILAFSKVDIGHANQSVISKSGISKNIRKGKKTERRSTTLKVKFPEARSSSTSLPSIDDFPLHGGFRRHQRTNLRNKKIRKRSLHHRQFIVSSDEDSDREANPAMRKSIKPIARDFEVWTEQKQKEVKKAPTVDASDSDIEASRTMRRMTIKPPSRDFRVWTELEQKEVKKYPVVEGNDSDIDVDSEREASLSMRRNTIKPTTRHFRVWTEPNQKKVKRARAMEPMETEEEEEEEEVGEFGCDVEGCNMNFCSRQELMTHKTNVCLEDECRKRFLSHKYLLHQRRVHVDEQPLECPWKGCEMTFKWERDQAKHIRAHIGDLPYASKEEGCGRTFRFVSNSSRHKWKTRHSLNKYV